MKRNKKIVKGGGDFYSRISKKTFFFRNHPIRGSFVRKAQKTHRKIVKKFLWGTFLGKIDFFDLKKSKTWVRKIFFGSKTIKIVFFD